MTTLKDAIEAVEDITRGYRLTQMSLPRIEHALTLLRRLDPDAERNVEEIARLLPALTNWEQRMIDARAILAALVQP